MPIAWIMVSLLTAGLFFAATNVPAQAQKTSNECLDIASKYLNVLGNLLKEPKPNGACALAKFLKGRHEEILKMYSAEPAECRASDLGKKLDNTLKTRVRQESNLAKRHCRRR